MVKVRGQYQLPLGTLCMQPFKHCVRKRVEPFCMESFRTEPFKDLDPAIQVQWAQRTSPAFSEHISASMTMVYQCTHDCWEWCSYANQTVKNTLYFTGGSSLLLFTCVHLAVCAHVLDPSISKLVIRFQWPVRLILHCCAMMKLVCSTMQVGYDITGANQWTFALNFNAFTDLEGMHVIDQLELLNVARLGFGRKFACLVWEFRHLILLLLLTGLDAKMVTGCYDAIILTQLKSLYS